MKDKLWKLPLYDDKWYVMGYKGICKEECCGLQHREYLFVYEKNWKPCINTT